jgi:single-strand DNA-binding protein
MASYNKVILIGNLTRDPELRYIPSGMGVCDFSLGLNTYIGKDSNEVCFVDCTAWGKTAENLSKYCSKGSPILVEGRLKMDTWEKDNVKHVKLKVNVDKIQFIGNGKKSEDSTASDNSSPPINSSDDNDIPI